RSVLPDVDYPAFVAELMAVPGKEQFQKNIMGNFLEGLALRTTAGITYSGLDAVHTDTRYTFITNHRDIVLDASFLNLGFLRAGKRTSEVAIGDNLLIYDWITDLVKLNGSFIVKRNVGITGALDAARQLSRYIHYAISSKKESIWIAQREGRAKDSDDKTQESVVKMLSLGGPGRMVENLASLNILPVAISYEFDPNDYLKAREFLLKHRDSNFKKSKHDDLFSMETGLLQFKGRVHFGLGRCITPEIEKIPVDTPKGEVARGVCALVDNAIHSHYLIYPINYVAYDKLFDTDRYSGSYTPAEETAVMEYIEGQLDKVEVEGVTADEREFMRHKMYEMYANPLKNKLLATGVS
ncbi:MAG: acyltransferase, partial [Duncaniella sp.]|nr:acyltransferase [Duncaniella sp.]